MIKEWLNRNWKILTYASLLLGFAGWALHSYLIYQASKDDVFGKWITQLDYNRFGEGPFEIVLIPAITVFILLTLYVFIMKWSN